MSSHTEPNRLIHETSPYLQQHAYNPVEWFSWGEEALQKAKQEDKPILVSIGYSSCHWCHVMERECFERDDIAQLMNENFVNIKVDREERPDIDQIYIEAVQNMGLNAGWPLNVFLTPDQKPFYGGTYFPAPNWMQLLQNVRNAFDNQREKLEESAGAFEKNLNISELKKFGLDQDAPLGSYQERMENLTGILTTVQDKIDKNKGGLSKAPKFPMPSVWQELLAINKINANENALHLVTTTLNNIALGGIYDQLGGGFARYSTDEDWFAPHFEKMLYDNGQLLSLYSEAYLLTGNPLYKQVIEQTTSFISREMTAPEGGFYSALDADSEGQEGRFYVWTWEELEDTLQSDTELIAQYYQLTKSGNWEHGYNILYPQQSPEAFAESQGMNAREFISKLQECKEKLFTAREKRERPGLDNKMIAGWNGLMLTGLVNAWFATDNNKMLELAQNNAEFIVSNLKNPDGAPLLRRTYADGKAMHISCLDDYAFVIQAFLNLYQATFDEKWAQEAKQLTGYVMEHFHDPDEGFFFYTDDQAEELIARKKDIIDNVIPSSNAAMAHNLWKTGHLFDNDEYTTLSEEMTGKMLKLIKAEPAFLSYWGKLYAEMSVPSSEIVIVGPEALENNIKVHQQNLVNIVTAGTTKNNGHNYQLPLLQNREAVNDKTTFYVCFNKTCQLPVYNLEEAYNQVLEARKG